MSLFSFFILVSMANEAIEFEIPSFSFPFSLFLSLFNVQTSINIYIVWLFSDKMCTWIVSIGKLRKKGLELWVGICTGLLDYDVYGSTSEQVNSHFFMHCVRVHLKLHKLLIHESDLTF